MTGYGETALVRGLAYLAEQQATIANNLANVDTTGFKRRAAVAQNTGARFQTLLQEQMSAVDFVEKPDMQRGVLRETGNRFDVAIDGPHWMQVRDQRGNTFYTRNGGLTIATDGTLTTRTGNAVLDTRGEPISVGGGDVAPSDIAFSPNGNVSNPQTGQSYGTLALVKLPDETALTPVGSGLFADTRKQNGTQAVTGLRQGYLEASNVDSLQELVQMITVQRSFAATQKALTGINRLQENLITNILR